MSENIILGKSDNIEYLVEPGFWLTARIRYRKNLVVRDETKEGGNKYKIQVLIEKAGNAELKRYVACCKELAAKTWPDLDYADINKSHHDVAKDDKAPEGLHKYVALNVNTRFDVELLDTQKRKADEGLFYPGCWVRIGIQPYTTKPPTGPTIGCWFSKIRFIKEDERLGGGASLEDDSYECDDVIVSNDSEDDDFA